MQMSEEGKLIGPFSNAGVKKDRGGGVVASKFRHGRKPIDVHLSSPACPAYARCLQTYPEDNS
jgi:hypothetical protein